jgi:hypothetical protein
MQVGRAKAKQKREIVEQKTSSGSSKKMQDGRAKAKQKIVYFCEI